MHLAPSPGNQPTRGEIKNSVAVALLALLLAALPAQGRIGETLEELTAQYGEGKLNGGTIRMPGHDQYEFKYKGRLIQTVIVDGKCAMEVVHNLGPKLTDPEIEEVLKTEGNGQSWGFNVADKRWIRSDNKLQAYREPGHDDFFFIEPTPEERAAQSAAPWAGSVDLLPLIDPRRDATVGTWKMENGRLVTTSDRNALQIPYEPPEEYDFRIVFSRTSGNENIIQIFSQQGRPAEWIMDGWQKKIFGFERVGGKNGNENATTVHASKGLQNGQTYTSVLRVRANGVTAFLDSQLISKWTTDFSDAGVHDIADLPNHRALGLSSRCPTVFFKIDLREVSGKAKAVSGALTAGTGSGLAPLSPEVKTWLESTDTTWQTLFRQEVTETYDAGLRKLKQQYLSTLDGAIAKTAGAGDLDGAIALRGEKQRVSESKSAALELDPAAGTPYLRQIRSAFSAQMTKLDSDRAARAKALHAKYDQLLAQAQTQLTQHGNLDDALQLKAKRDQIASQWLKAAEPLPAGARAGSGQR